MNTVHNERIVRRIENQNIAFDVFRMFVRFNFTFRNLCGPSEEVIFDVQKRWTEYLFRIMECEDIFERHHRQSEFIDLFIDPEIKIERSSLDRFGLRDEHFRNFSLAKSLLGWFAYGVAGITLPEQIHRHQNEPSDGDEFEKPTWWMDLFIKSSGSSRIFILNHIKSFIPSNWADEFLGDAERGLLAADGRWKIDESREPLTLEELACLADVALKTVRNLAYKGDLPRIEDGRVSADAAEKWLLNVDGFIPSQSHVSMTQDQDYTTEDNSAPNIEDPVFVPFDSNGRIFMPEYVRSGRYTVGRKYTEQKFDDYWTALHHLQQMETPRWRRPSEASGQMGIVTGKGWRRESRSALKERIVALLK